MKEPENLLAYVVDVSRRMVAIHDLDTLLSYVLNEVLQLVDAEYGYLVLINDTGELDFKAAHPGELISMQNEIEDQISHSILRFVAENGAPLVLGNAVMDPRFAHAKSVIHHHLRSVVCVPLMTHERTIGAIYVENRSLEGVFGEEDVGPMVLFANQAAVSIDSTRLYNTLEERVRMRTVELGEITWQLTGALRELARSKKQADAANQAKSAFLAHMSHELRTPLNGILGYAQILQRDANLTDTQREGLQIIYDSGQHLLLLINDVLDLAKVEAGRVELYPAELHLPSFLDGIVTLMQRAAQQNDLQLVYHVDPDLPAYVLADETRLRQVLLNLLGNAIKFTKRGKVVFEVSTCQPPPRAAVDTSAKLETHSLRFSVLDTGPGISKGKLKDIFRPFTQAGTVAQQAAGAGLGLAISQQLVALMGGQIQVKSKPEQGSTFWFEVTFPLVDVVSVQKISPLIICGYQGRRRRILVVDDRPENQAVLLSFLEPLGFEIDLASNGQDALRQVVQVHPDMVLIDLIMPGMSGFEVVKNIRALPELAHVPIIAISASVGEVEQNYSQEVGCNGFLAKPIEMDTLLVILQQQLGIKWQYEQEGDAEVGKGEDIMHAQPDDIVFPPEPALETLHNLARTGNLNRIREFTAELEEESTDYLPFTQMINRLVDDFDMRQIRNLTEQHLSTGQNVNKVE